MPHKFWDQVDKSDGCWIWTGRLNGKGYGQVYIDKVNQFAHRYSWAIHRGTIPKGLFVLHKCDDRKCVNPEHLFLGTHKENMQDMVNKDRQSCRVGSLNLHSKLTEEQVKSMRLMRLSGTHYEDLATLFHMSVRHVKDICSGRYWKHVST